MRPKLQPISTWSVSWLQLLGLLHFRGASGRGTLGQGFTGASQHDLDGNASAFLHLGNWLSTRACRARLFKASAARTFRGTGTEPVRACAWLGQERARW